MVVIKLGQCHLERDSRHGINEAKDAIL
uniref:Uncharacterized protein n=1 Tax=Rhizophora mucronata TaxID=61149 RepID=A0A2P2QJM6_RHIMU